MKMTFKLTVLTFAAVLTLTYGVQPTNYDLSRNRKNGARNGFTIRDIWDYLLGAGYGNGYQGNYPGYYPGGSGLYPGSGYQGQYPGSHYPGYRPGLEGPPGAHPGCPLCDSSVYSYCSHKQAHDSCCCESSPYLSHCRGPSDCKFIYANSCQEYHLITNCCCVDLQKNAIVAPFVAAP